MRLRLGSVLLWAVFATGCGGSADIAADSGPKAQDVPPPATGKLEVQLGQARARAVTADVRRLRCKAYDERGGLVYGPVEIDVADFVPLKSVPVTAISLEIEYVSGPDSVIVGRAVVSPIAVKAAGTTMVSNPTFEVVESFRSLRVTPGTSPLAPHKAISLHAFGSLGNGREAEVTQRVHWTSSDPSRLRVSNVPGGRGKAIAGGDSRNADVEVTARTGLDQVIVASSTGGQGALSAFSPRYGEVLVNLFGAVETFSSVASLDLDGDGRDEVVVAAGSRVSGRDRQGADTFVMEPWAALPGTRLNLAAADLDGDGLDDLIVAGVTLEGRPQVRAYSGKSLANNTPPEVLFTLGGLSGNFATGIHVAAGQDADGQPVMALGAGPGRSPEVRVYRLLEASGERLLPRLAAQRLAFAASDRGGARVALGDVDSDGALDLIAASGPGVPPVVMASALEIGREIWRSNLANVAAADGVAVASGQLYGGTSDDVVACVSLADGPDATWILDGATGAKAEAYRGYGDDGVSVATGHVSEDDLVATAKVHLTTAKAASLDLDPAVLSLGVAKPTGRLRAKARFSDGETVDVTDLVTLRLRAGSSATATLGEGGLVTALDAGKATVEATYSGLTAQARVSVDGPPVPKSLSITPVDASARVGSDVPFQALASLEGGTVADFTQRVLWSSSSETSLRVASSAPRHGLATVLAEGEVSVKAADAITGVAGAMTFTGLSRKPPQGIALFPPELHLGRGGAQHLDLYGLYPGGRRVPLTSDVVWTSSHPRVSVDGNGVVKAGEESANATITATIPSLGLSSKVEVTVAIAKPALVSLSPVPERPVMRPGESLVLDIFGNLDSNRREEMDGDTLAFSSSRPEVITVSAGGRLRTGNSTGVAFVTITSAEGVRAVVPVLVEAPASPLLTLAVELDSRTTVDGVSTAAVARGAYKGESPRDVTGSVAWTSSNEDVATVDANGGITTHSPGRATIVATSAGVSGQAVLEVAAPRLLSLMVLPGSPTLLMPALPSGQTRKLFTANGLYTNGDVVDETSAVAWTSLTPAIISFASPDDGTAAASGVGLATIVARIGDVTASAVVTVLPAPSL